MLQEFAMPGRIARWRRDERGATAVEFALVAPLLFFALISLIEVGLMGMTVSGLDNAVVEVGRKIRTGRADRPTSAEAFKSQVCAVVGSVAASCYDRLTVSVEKFASFSNANQLADTPPQNQFDSGGPGDIIVVKADFKWPAMTPFLAAAYHSGGPNEVTLAARTVFKNEPYK
jgi:Flp pilus assembly protein TadG